jgi:hypothetical protein
MSVATNVNKKGQEYEYVWDNVCLFDPIVYAVDGPLFGQCRVRLPARAAWHSSSAHCVNEGCPNTFRTMDAQGRNGPYWYWYNVETGAKHDHRYLIKRAVIGDDLVFDTMGDFRDVLAPNAK